MVAKIDQYLTIVGHNKTQTMYVFLGLNRYLSVMNSVLNVWVAGVWVWHQVSLLSNNISMVNYRGSNENCFLSTVLLLQSRQFGNMGGTSSPTWTTILWLLGNWRQNSFSPVEPFSVEQTGPVRQKRGHAIKEMNKKTHVSVWFIQLYLLSIYAPLCSFSIAS